MLVRVLQPLRWCCVDCMIHHERDVREEQKYMYVARTSNNRVVPLEWSWWMTSNDACEPGEQLIVLGNGDDESDLVGWSLLLLAATVRSFAHMPLGISESNKRISMEISVGVGLHAWCPVASKRFVAFSKKRKCARKLFIVFVRLSDLNKASNRALTHTS